MGGDVTQPLELLLQLHLLVLQGGGLLPGRLDQTLQLGFTGDVGASQEVSLLGLALEASQLLTRLLQATLGCHDLLVELGMPLLAVGQHHIQLFKTGVSRGTALLNGIQLSLNLLQVGLDLGGACTRLIGLLGQSQRLHLELVGLCLCRRSFAAQFNQTLAGVAVRGLRAHQQVASFLMNEGLSASLFLEVFNLLGPGEQSRLFAVGGIEIHAVSTHRVTLRHQNPLTGLQTLTLGQGL